MKVSVLGIDLGKNACSIVGLDATGAMVLRRRAKRETLIALAAKQPLFITIGMPGPGCAAPPPRKHLSSSRRLLCFLARARRVRAKPLQPDAAVAFAVRAQRRREQ